MVSENECGIQQTYVRNYSLCVDSLWTQQQEDFSIDNNFQGISFGNQSIGMAISQNERVFRTQDEGVTWQLLSTFPTLQDGGFLIEVEMLDEASAIITGSNTYITRDGGETWQEQAVQSIYREISVRDDLIVLFLGNNLAISQDGGNSWVEKSVPSELDLDDLRILESGRLITTSANKLFSYSDDLGTTWSTIQLDESIPGPTYAIQFVSESVGFIGANGAILKTIDGGLTWSEFLLPRTSLISDIEFEDDLNGWAVGGHIWRTNDGGESWNIEFCQNNNIGHRAISDIEISPEGAIYTNIAQRGVFEYTPESDFQCNTTSTESILTNETLSISPNPGFNSITVQSSLDEGNLYIYTNTGIELFEKRFTNPIFNIDVKAWPSGVYFFRLRTDNRLGETIKFVKI